MTAPERNWAGNYTYRAAAIRRPTSVAELAELVAHSRRVHAIGSRHSFSGIADTDGELISLDAMQPSLALAADRRSITVGAGARYGAVASFLAGEGLALRNYASLPHISVAGAISTGTHGSGDSNACLAADVLALDIVDASGQLRRCSREALGDEFAGVVVGLGALGVITAVTLAVVRAFDVRQDVYLELPWAAFEVHVDELTALAYSVSMFTDYTERGIGQLWLKSRVDAVATEPPGELFGARRATVACHPVPGLDAASATEQLGVAGPSHERLPHFRLAFTPSNGEEIQSEYLIDRRDVVPAVEAVRRLGPRVATLLQIGEIRSVAADDLWLSPSSGRDTIGLHFTWVRDQPAVEALLADLEDALAPFDARPHWGKLFVAGAPRLREVYPALSRFARLRAEWDPAGRFGNAFLDTVLGAVA